MRDAHWSLCAVNFHEKQISYWDSLSRKKNHCVQVTKNIPLQEDFDDCGVFVCMYGDHIARDVSCSFTAEDILQIRFMMMDEIISAGLQPRPLILRREMKQPNVQPVKRKNCNLKNKEKVENDTRLNSNFSLNKQLKLPPDTTSQESSILHLNYGEPN
ncbi:hypothetical protein HCN44_005954 [Aphidius gifuensis]|uniref:Ubiquitin-like protease family profile domain-containing protein n=1 Tax=Aphidius gifuensis TaxID=684658 RepID=A0A835CSS2_APHGI|nr:hypothetical protein HCN44_005954 [Aphidius gifuensis]